MPSATSTEGDAGARARRRSWPAPAAERLVDLCQDPLRALRQVLRGEVQHRVALGGDLVAPAQVALEVLAPGVVLLAVPLDQHRVVVAAQVGPVWKAGDLELLDEREAGVEHQPHQALLELAGRRTVQRIPPVEQCPEGFRPAPAEA